MLESLFIPVGTALHLTALSLADDQITADLTSTAVTAPCLRCQSIATRIHSHYQRTLADLPVLQHPVRLILHARRFFCDNPACTQRIFGERLPTLTTPSARRTTRLATEQRQIALEVGSEAGARLAQLGGAAQQSQLIGIDRHDFAEVVRWDDAWSGGQPLAVVLNQLAQTPQAVLISRALADRGVQPGQTINGSVTILNERHTLRGKVVGVVDLWPGVYPEDGPFVIANLGAVFEQLGDQYPYDVWIRRDPSLPLEQLTSEVRRLGVLLIDVRDHATLLHEAETNPQRQGLFGMLSLGFGAAALLSMLGFMLMALIGARRRVIELGTLAALGLKQRHVIAAMGLEYLLIIAVGMGGGSLIGSLVVHH